MTVPSFTVRTRLPSLVALSCVFCTAACGSDADGGSVGHLVRDSAGIRIVENATPAWSDDDAWRVDEAASLDIGGGDGGPGSELYRIRGAVALPDGRVVIANAGTFELRFYGARGEFLSAAGSQGDGPGEFQGISWIMRFGGDSLLVFDRRLLRLTVFDADGRFQRSIAVRDIGGIMVQVVGVFGDGSLLSYGSPMRDQDGAYRERDIVFRLASDGGVLDSLGDFPGSEAFVRDLNPGPVMGGPPYFHRSSLYLVRDTQFYVATNDTYEIGVYSRTGDLVSLIRRQFIPLPVTEEAVRTERERMVNLRGPHPMRPQLEEFADARPVPETMPAYAGITHDEAGNLWVEEYRYPDDEVSQWTVFDPAGVMLGTVRLPPGFSLLYAGEGFVLGTWRDELDIDHVRRHALIKP